MFVGKKNIDHKEKDLEPGYEHLRDYLRPITIERVEEILQYLNIRYKSVRQELRTKDNTYQTTKVVIKLKLLSKPNWQLANNINRYLPTNYNVTYEGYFGGEFK